MKHLLFFFLIALGAIRAHAQAPDPTRRMNDNLRRSGNYGLYPKADSAKLAGIGAGAGSGAPIDTTLLATKASVNPKFATINTQISGLNTSLTSKINYSDTTLFVRKIAGTRLFTNTEASKLAGLPSNAVDASTYSTNRTADLQAATNPANLVQNATYRFTTDNEKQAWNAKEGSLGNPSANGYILSSSASGVRSWIPAPSAGGGATTNAAALTDGTLDDARLSANVVKATTTYTDPSWLTLNAAKITESTTKRFLSDTKISQYDTYATSKLNYSDTTLFVRKLANTRLFTLTEASKLAGLPTSAVDATTYGTNRTADQADIANRLLTSTYNTNRTTDQAAVTTASTNASAALTSANSATAAVAGKASLTGATFTGAVSAPTAATNTATDQVATTLYTRNELQRWFQDSLTTYGPGFDPAQFVRVDSASTSFIRIKSSILGTSTGTGSGTVVVDNALNASSNNPLSNAATTAAINANSASIATNTSSINTLFASTFKPVISGFTATPGTTTVALTWNASQTTIAESMVVSFPTYAQAVAGLAGRTTPCRVLITADEVNNAGAFGKYDYDGTNLIEDLL